MAATSLCYVNAISVTSLANAVFLLYLGPVLAVALAALILKEQFNRFNLVILLLAFLGFMCLLDFKINFATGSSQGYLWGLGAGLCYALSIVFNRMIPKDIPALTRAFYQFLFGTLTLLPFFNKTVLSVSRTDLFWILGIGLFHGFLAFTLAIFALKHLKAVEFGTISYLEPLMASGVGLMLYGERLSGVQIVGCSLVFIAGIMQVVFAHRFAKLTKFD